MLVLDIIAFIVIVVALITAKIHIRSLEYRLNIKEKSWRTLKAESGYRRTKNMIGIEDLTIKELMDNMEKREDRK
jgi:hypothetical protein